MLHRYTELQDRFRLGDGYSMDLRIATVLRGLGFSTGGRRRGRPKRSPAAGRCASRWPSCCSAGPTCCCSTSRPTTSTSTRATGSRNTSAPIPYAVILVSHDRYFLDAVVTRITDLQPAHARPTTSATTAKYVEQRDAMLERLRQAKREQDEEVARVKMFIDRFRYQATKAAQVQSRIKMLEKVVPIEVPPERKRIHFTFPDVRQERPHGARARSTCARPTARSRSSATSTCTSSAATASRWSARTAPASRR